MFQIAQDITVYALSPIINSTPFHSQKGPGLDNELQNHPILGATLWFSSLFLLWLWGDLFWKLQGVESREKLVSSSFASGKGSEEDKAVLNEEVPIANPSQSLHSPSSGANFTCI